MLYITEDHINLDLLHYLDLVQMNSVSCRYGHRFSSNRNLVPAKYLLRYFSRISSRTRPKVSLFTHLCGKSINVKPLINSNLKIHDSKGKNEVILMFVYEILPQ